MIMETYESDGTIINGEIIKTWEIYVLTECMKWLKLGSLNLATEK